MREKIVYKSVAALPKVTKVEDELLKAESRKKVEICTLSRAVQAQMTEKLAEFCFLAGYTTLMVCDNEENCLLYKQKKIKR